MKVQFQQKSLYFILMLLSALLAVFALGPGIYHGDAHHGFAFQYLIFDYLCHQDPARSFEVNGTQMAVCSRCFGIYFSFFLGVLAMIPLSMVSKRLRILVKPAFFTALLLNFIDVFANAMGFWVNTLFSRFWLGILVGLATAFLLSNEFFKIKLNSEENYGTGSNTR